MMKAGIYIIKNLIDGKVYVGQSTQVDVRIRKHKYNLSKGIHHNGHLQSAWNLLGRDNFSFNIILLCDSQKLDYYERIYIKEYRSNDRLYGYNYEDGENEKKKVSMESRIKMSMSHKGKSSARKGKKLSQDQIEKMRLSMLGRTLSDETKKKISQSNKGKNLKGHPQTPETRKKISESSKGKILSDHCKHLLSVALTGRIFSESHRQNISSSHKGLTPSEETRIKLSASMRGLKRNNSSSKYIGVCWKSREQKWHSRLSVNKRQISIGWYINEVDAAKAYDDFALKYFGYSAKINFPNEYNKS